MSASEFRTISFETPPAEDTVVVSKEQRYVFSGAEQYTRADGTVVPLLRWASTCAKCSDQFEFKTSLKQPYPNRRCSKCSRPGSKAR